MNINKKGYIYTISAIILILILIFFILFYSRFTETETVDLTSKVRCDELHFFVEDTKVDLERGLMITGRRAAIYAISNQIMGENKITPDYEFNCTGFNYSGVGAEAAIAELMLCGTLYGDPDLAHYMKDHTIKAWIGKLTKHASASGFHVTMMTPTGFKLTPYDAWNFTSDLNLTVEINDGAGMCYFSSSNLSVNFMTSMEGIEDPLYAQNTGYKVMKQVQDCKIEMHAEKLRLAEGDYGWGWTVGTAVLIKNDNSSEITNKLSTANKSKILVTDQQAVFNGSYDSDLENYKGIITTKSNASILTKLDHLNISYLAGVTAIGDLTENMSIILLASKYYLIDISEEGYGTAGACDNTKDCAIYKESDSTCYLKQEGWFSKRLQTDTGGSYPVNFLFPKTQECQIAPQLEDNNTWNYTLPIPTKTKNLHLIMSSSDTADYEINITYQDNDSEMVTIEICGHCESCISGGSDYDSNFVSQNLNSTVGDFKDVFWDVTNSSCSPLPPILLGETVQHITIHTDKDKYLKEISITDPNELVSPGIDPVIWAVTIEMAPMSIWKINSNNISNYTTSPLFNCYNLSMVGPSFFDRIENNKQITENYKNQTNNTLGLESFLSNDVLYFYGADTYSNRTAIDYLYFSEDIRGYYLIGANESGIGYFRIDPDYALKYGVYDLIDREESTGTL